MIRPTEGSSPFTAVYETEGVVREQEFTAHNFAAAAEVLQAGSRFDERPAGVWHRHVFYRWEGKGAGGTGIGFVSEPGRRRE